MIRCEKCNNEFQGNYCPNCGHPSTVERITGRYIVTEIASVFNLQKGFFYTVKELVIRPGDSIRTFISEDRSRMAKPIVFVLICSLIYTIVINVFHFESGLTNNTSAPLDSAIYNWVQNNYGYANIIMAFFIGFWLKLFFRKYPYNFFEVLVLLCYIMGIGMLIYSVFDIISSFTHANLIAAEVIVGFIYTTFAIAQFYNKRKTSSYIKAFVAYLMGMLVFTLALLCLVVLFE